MHNYLFVLMQVITILLAIFSFPLKSWAQASANNSAFQIGASSLFAATASTLKDESLSQLRGGGHDPNRNGFNIQNIELSLAGAVDPYFDAQTNLIFLINEAGETIVELEEAFLLSRALPLGLQLKAGQFFTEFGRQNSQHPHTWAFADQPVILTRLFGGDGLRGQGLRLSWLSPFPWYSEFLVSTQNANGETMRSFLFAEDEAVAGQTLGRRDVNSLDDFLYGVRWLNGFDLSSTLSANIGLSALFGPNAIDVATQTQIQGLDFYMKWQASRSQKGFPFIAWHSEWLQRDYQINASQSLVDQGFFTQVQWGFTPGWIAGLRYEQATANEAATHDSLRDQRSRISSNLTWFSSEFAKIRLQHNLDQAEHLNQQWQHSLSLQFEVNLGAHMAHTF
ncbi:MAG: zinc-regulated TonB-dependent outer membrane receptor [Gammaproteobacteria bacterium]|nr:zinc-regulated TonB-dependent outer membrane receptor [Gammaproteobacteria bacterium]MDH5729226.1 zinc-regulated TonB-dependent outer membrane receptor [Gammaproteobacteria bacterium]